MAKECVVVTIIIIVVVVVVVIIIIITIIIIIIIITNTTTTTTTITTTTIILLLLLLLLFCCCYYYHFTVHISDIVEGVLMVYKSLPSSQMQAMKVGRGWYISVFVTWTKKIIRPIISDQILK